MKLTTLFSAFFLAVTIGATSVQAATYRIEIEGVVTSEPTGSFNGLISQYDTFEFSLLFNDQYAPDGTSNLDYREYVFIGPAVTFEGARIGMNVGMIPRATDAPGIYFTDVSAGGAMDRLILFSGSLTNINANWIVNFNFEKVDQDFSSGDWGTILTEMLQPENFFVSPPFRTEFFERGDGYDIEFTKLSVSVVPLPAGLPLLAGGLIAFGLIRRRR